MAKRYKFRLETLLRLRKQQEDQQKRVVASRLREVRTLRERSQYLSTEIAHHQDQTRLSLSQARMDLDDLKLGRHWLIRLRRGVLAADAQITTQRSLLAQERADLTEARKQTKVLERLKERQRQAYLVELNRRERAELDEMNVTRFAHALLARGDAAS